MYLKLFFHPIDQYEIFFKFLFSIVIITSFQTFFAYGVTTAYTNVYESPANFPAITICNLEAFDTYANLNLIQSILNKNGMNITITPSNQSPGINQLRIITNYLKAYFISNTTSNQTYLQSIGFTISSLLISCYFNNQPCSESDFSWFYDFNYGNCYTFNSNTTSIKKTSKAGPTYGLQLELFTGIPGYQDLLASERGIYLAVTNNSASPLTSYDGIKLSVGQATNIRVKRTFVSNLDYPFSNCRMDTTSKFSSDNSLYIRTLEINQYSLQLCYDLCLQKLFTMPTCNCSDPSLPQYDKSLSICNTNLKLSCANQVRDRFDSSSISDSCSSYCPPPCNYATYDTLVSSSSYPTSYYYNNILASTPNLQTKFKGFSLNETIVKESVLKVNIFYDSLNYLTLIDSQTVTISTLFGTVGGQLGLFLGKYI